MIDRWSPGHGRASSTSVYCAHPSLSGIAHGDSCAWQSRTGERIGSGWYDSRARVWAAIVAKR